MTPSARAVCIGRFGRIPRACAKVAVVITLSASAHAQQPSSAPGAAASPTSCAQRGFLPAPGTYRSVEQLPDGRVTFRLCAPDATKVSVTSSDAAEVIPMGFGGGPVGLPLSKDSMGLWSVTTPVPMTPLTYRFNFSVDGVAVPDPQGTTYSQTRIGTISTVEVMGPQGSFQSYDRNVPHGAVAEIEYWSSSLGVKRRAHVYTPPGYMRDSKKYPVLYLVHGAGDSDDSWTSIGHAHYILDNLLAAGKAKPMIVVMPFGHTPERAGADMLTNTDFASDFLKDLIPYVEASYRTINKPASRAMAGLSMGGAHTLNTGLPHAELFGYIGIFSMGFMAPQQAMDYETMNAAALDKGAGKFKLVYYAMGKTDFLYSSVAPTRAMLDKHGIKHVYNESDGGHTWVNWRHYLEDFAPRLFK